ncbi:hypothetical protein SynA1524_01054 [Synechococcus sp. A15-24]|nr:hypothetical protein SynA1524_01054 [Synechococcus sp. A15-24]
MSHLGVPRGVSGVNLFSDFALPCPFPSTESLHRWGVWWLELV